MRSKTRLRFLLWMIFGTVIFIAAIIISIAKHENSLRDRRERRLLQLIESEEYQNKRQSRLTQSCYEKYGSRPTNISSLEYIIESIHTYLDHLIVDDINKLIYCFVPKVASTNWKRVLLALNLKSNQNFDEINPLFIKGNESHVPTAFKTLNQYNNVTEIAIKLKYFTKFVFVRHPYERLLSAYRNKLENTYSDYFRNRFGRKIIKQLRKNASNESLEKGHDVTFSEFLSYITKLNQTDHKKEFNEHWRPIFDLCFPCIVDYDLIGKYETLHNDAQLVLWKAHVIDLIKFPKREDTYSNQPSKDLIIQYYSNISEDLMGKIADIYSEDLQLFDYRKQIDKINFQNFDNNL